MSLSCTACGGAVEMTYGTSRNLPDVEFEEEYRCVCCNRSGRLLVAVDGSERRTGCLA